MSIDKEILEELLNTKTELQFIKIAYREKIPKHEWEKYANVREHYTKLKEFNNGISVYDNIGYLRKKNK